MAASPKFFTYSIKPTEREVAPVDRVDIGRVSKTIENSA